jgi:c(7)-type cytochrome triheme protein
MSATQLRLIFSLLMICFVSYSCNSVPESAQSGISEAGNPVAGSQVPEQTSEKTQAVAKKTNQSIPPKAPKTVNQFNRLLKNTSKKDGSLINDGIHDAKGAGIKILQNPHDAFADLPKAKGGNTVDWVKAAAMGKIKPRSDLRDPNAEALVMDLNIVREVKGSMPDVVFPHKQHTELLDCTNCHPGIFIPQKGANAMSMAKNLMGQMCGVCHGKVAFPLSNCTNCHSKKKPEKEVKKTQWKWP